MSKPPRLTAALIGLLDHIAQMPFVDTRELTELTGARRSTTAYQLDGLSKLGLVSSAPHAGGIIARTRRFFPTTAGVHTLADDQGVSPGSLMRESPLHPEAMRSLVRRADVVAMTYRLTTRIIALTADRPTATVDHFTTGPLDAVIRLATGPTIGIVYRGRTQTWRVFQRNWTNIVRHEQLWPDVVLVLTSTDGLWRYTVQQVWESAGGPPAYCAFWVDALRARAAQFEMWSSPSRKEGVASLATIVRQLPDKPRSSPAKPGGRRATSISLYPESFASSHPAFRMRASEKALLNTIYDWPLVRRSYLPKLAGVATEYVTEMVNALDDLGLITRLDLHRGSSVALSDEGLAYGAYRARMATGARYSSMSVEVPNPQRWFGSHIRRLHRDFFHTHGEPTHGQLAVEARGHDRYLLTEMDPPERAVCRSGQKREFHRIAPDAFFTVLYTDDAGETRDIACVLECQGRANIGVDHVYRQPR